jgi:ankyrin repeat protein
MFSRYSSSTIVLTENRILEILLNNNLTELQKLITTSNVNNILNKHNKYTALHYAIKFELNDIIEFLISKNGNLLAIDSLGNDCYDLALKYNIKIILDKMKRPKDEEVRVLKEEINAKKRRIEDLEYKNNDLKHENEYISKINSDLNEKNKKLKDDNHDLTVAFNNAMKKHKT